MPGKTNRRWIFALLLAILFPALAVHGSCVAVLGVGSWGSGVEEKVPEILAADSHPAIERYRLEFASGSRPDPLEELPNHAEVVIPGRIVSADFYQPAARWVVQSHSGARWIDDQHLYVWNEGPNQPIELEIPDGFVVERPVFVSEDGNPVVLVTRWNSWYLPAVEKLGRYVRSWLDPTLRPEHSLYRYVESSGSLEYAGPGHSPAVAPDRTKVVFLRSGALFTGFYSMHLWDLTSGEVVTMLSLRESDPGSGRSFDYRWSKDSRAVHISGRISGFAQKQEEPRDLDLVYGIENSKLYERN